MTRLASRTAFAQHLHQIFFRRNIPNPFSDHLDCFIPENHCRMKIWLGWRYDTFSPILQVRQKEIWSFFIDRWITRFQRFVGNHFGRKVWDICQGDCERYSVDGWRIFDIAGGFTIQLSQSGMGLSKNICESWNAARMGLCRQPVVHIVHLTSGTKILLFPSFCQHYMSGKNSCMLGQVLSSTGRHNIDFGTFVEI